MPTLSDVKRAICCPGGQCIAPEACYARDRSRSYPVNIHAAALAVVALIRDAGEEFTTYLARAEREQRKFPLDR